MAAIATILGGFVGFILAILAYFVVGTGIMVALAVWTFGGIGLLMAAMVYGHLSRADQSVPARA